MLRCKAQIGAITAMTLLLGASPQAQAQAPQRATTQTEIVFAVAGLGTQPVIGYVVPGDLTAEVVVKFFRKTPDGWDLRGRKRAVTNNPSDTVPGMALFNTSFKQIERDGKCKLTVRFPGTDELEPSATRRVFFCPSGYTY